MKTKLILLFLCSCHFSLMAQERFESYSKKDGLTSSEVTVTLADSRGVVWIGTSNGLTAYSGSKWYTLKNVEDNESGKAKAFGRIEVLFEDSKRNLWVSSSAGLFLFDGKSWTSFKKDDNDSYLPTNFVEDRQGRIWIEYEYIQVINASVQMNFKLTNGMLHMYNSGRWINFDDIIGGSSTIVPGYPTAYFSNLFQDRMGNIWVGTQEGAFSFDGHNWSTFDEDDLKSEKVMCLMEDHQGGVWAGMDNGIARQKNDGWVNYKKKDGLNGSNIYQLIEDNQSRIWAFSRTNLKFAGLTMFADEQWYPFTKKDFKLKNTIESLTMNQDEVIAFAKDGLAVFRNNLWYKYGKKEGLADKHFSMILKDRYGIWLAGENGFYKLKEGKWEQLYKSTDKWNVKVIFIEDREHIWLGTERDGVYRFTNNSWEHYTVDSGLADNRILNIFKDKSGLIWIVSKSGVSRVLRK
jgi:ligand-binding sensor domain-containing protein